MSDDRLRVAIVGAGVIAEPYGKELVADPMIEVAGVTDLAAARAEKLAQTLGVPIYPTFDAVLADPTVQAVVNLTPHRVHAGVSLQVLCAGKHAYSEKPMAVTREEARSLVDEARVRELRLASAPSMFMSEASQTAWKALREEMIGTVRLIYAEVNWGRIETWHPAPESFYDIGVMMDVGIYPLSLLTAIVGPARRVWAYGTVLKPDRVTKRGAPFTIHTPELIVAMVEFASGPLLRLTTNWYVETPHSTQAPGVEFHGDDGSLVLSNWLDGDASITRSLRAGKGWEEIPLVRPCERSVVWSRAVSEMARAIVEHRPHRADGDHGAHLVDILCSIDESIASGGLVDVRSTFTPPEPMEWAR